MSIIGVFYVLIGLVVLISILLSLFLAQMKKMTACQQQLDYLNKDWKNLQQKDQEFLKETREFQQVQLKQNHQHQLDTIKVSQENLTHLQNQLSTILNQRIAAQNEQITQMQQMVDRRLQQIAGQVETRLQQGFEKTTATFTDVIKRLALIDEAQKKISALSENVMGLQDILADKRARGAFGEVQLEMLIKNVIPENHFALQYTLSNGKRCDCILFLPEPTGSIVIDAKFPLESYQILSDPCSSDSQKKEAERQFKQDVKKHIRDIAEKYIIEKETSEGAMMFIPAEAVFAEIHAHHPDLVAEAHQLRVWLTSPTTLMAVLTTARAVLKDAATRKQIHLIQEHLHGLAKDFERFQIRMDNLGKHIAQANKDVQEVQTSATKISSRFAKIDQVELHQIGVADSE